MESKSQTQQRHFRIERHGIPIQDYIIRSSVNPGIKYSDSFAEIEACVAAGLDLWKWENCEYSDSFKIRVVAWYQMHNVVSQHIEDARQEDYKRQSNKKSK